MMGLSVLLCILFTTGGLAMSYAAALPAGATIILLAGAVYLAVTAVLAVVGKERLPE